MALETSGFVPKGNLDTNGEALSKTSQRDTVKRVLARLGKYNLLIIISLLLAMVSVVFTLLVPIKIGDAIDSLAIGPFSFEKNALNDSLLLAGVFALTVGLSQWLMNLINNRITYLAVRDIRNDAVKRLHSLPLGYIDSHSHGDIISRIIADADQLADGLLMGFTQAFTGILTILGTLFFMLRLNAVITLVVVLVTPLSLFVAKYVSSKTYDMFRLQGRERGEQTALIDEMIGNEKVVKAFGQEDRVAERFDEINERLQRSSMRAIFFSSITNPATRFVNAVCYALVALAGSFYVLSRGSNELLGGISVGTLTVFLSYANQYTKPFNEISSVISELQNAIACAARVFEVMDEQTEDPDTDKAELENITGNVSLRNVDFSYTKEKPLIEDLTLNVKPGQRVAIVGPTGAGKTTIINLLMRFYDTDSGQITVEGCDIRKLKRRSLREAYGMVLQDTWIKKGTIRDNIRLSKPDAKDEEVIKAAKASYAHSFIRRLPNGYDTVIGEEAGGLSQGQRQLLCIARIMMNIPPMLILDEATSSIDTRTEMKIQDAFSSMMKGRTSFIVAHRLSTIRSADVILVMKNGHIIEQGDHESLLKQKGFYYELYNSQFQGTKGR